MCAAAHKRGDYMEFLKDRRKINSVIFMLSAIYMVSYLTRNNYSTVISTIITAEGFTKEVASYAVTASLITYGAGQLLSGFFGDRIQPRILIIAGLITSSAMNLMLPFSGSPYLNAALWAVNGLAQAFMWPPMVKLMTAVFDPETYSSACVKVSYGSAAGTLLLYLCCPLIIRLAGWKYCFFISAASGIIMAVITYCFCPKIDMNRKAVKQIAEAEKKGADSIRLPKILILITGIIMIGIILQGSLRDGVTTWMPTFIKETFSLGDEISILSGVFLPIFSMLSYSLTLFIHKKLIKNELLCAGAIFTLCAMVSAILGFVYDKSPIISVPLIAVIVACMHGANLILVCMVPAKYNKYGNVSFISGLLNSCTYIGSAISTYAIAVYSDNFGWRATVFLWVGIAALGAAICAIVSRPWKKTTD